MDRHFTTFLSKSQSFFTNSIYIHKNRGVYFFTLVILTKNVVRRVVLKKNTILGIKPFFCVFYVLLLTFLCNFLTFK